VNVQNVDGKTPLHIAIERQQSEVVRFLLNAGADIGLTDVWRNTPLHYLTAGQLQCRGYDEFVVKQAKKSQQLLISSAVCVTAQTSAAQTMDFVDYAKHKQNSNPLFRTDIHSEQLAHDFSSSISCLLELCHTKTKVCEDLQHNDCYGNTLLHYAVGVCAHLKMYRVCLKALTGNTLLCSGPSGSVMRS